MTRPLLALLALTLAACQVKGPSLAGYQGLQTTVMWHYRNHAVEENGICRTPEMRTITRTTVIEDTDERLVVDLRYRYRDTFFRDDDRRFKLIDNCEGFNNRRFVIDKQDGKLSVAEMSGPVNTTRHTFQG